MYVILSFAISHRKMCTYTISKTVNSLFCVKVNNEFPARTTNFHQIRQSSSWSSFPKNVINAWNMGPHRLVIDSWNILTSFFHFIQNYHVYVLHRISNDEHWTTMHRISLAAILHSVAEISLIYGVLKFHYYNFINWIVSNELKV